MSRVVLVVWGFEPFGGMERHVCELALALHRAGRDVAVVSEMPVARSNPYARRLRAGGVALHAPPIKLRLVNGLAIAARRSAAPRLIHGGGPLSRQLRRTLETLTVPGRGDVIHIHGCRLGQSWLVDWARRRQVASVYTEHVAIAESGGPMVPDSPDLVSAAGVIACVSDQSRSSLATLLPPGQPIAVTGHIVNSTPVVVENRAAGSTFDLVCVARLEARKGIDTLLEAVADLLTRSVPVHLTVLGDGPLAYVLEDLAAKLGIGHAVCFAGRIPPHDVAGRIAQAAAVVVASRSEGLPLALVEAMSCGKAIVATRAGGIPEVIQDHENGLLVPIDDPAALAAALAELASDRDLRARLGENARRSWASGPHRAEQVVPAMLQLYRVAEAAC